MRIHVDYVTRYEYEAPARLIQQVLRLTPRPYEGQHVREWRLDIDADGRLRGGEDAFGNLTHTLSVAGPVRRLQAHVTGEVVTFESGGVVQGAVERFPPLVFLRDTPLTHADAKLQAFAAEARAMGDTPLRRMHALLGEVHQRVEFDCDPTDVATSAAEAFAINKGCARTWPTSSSPAPAPWACRRATSRATWPGATARSTRRRPTPGARPMSRTWAGWGSTRPTASVPPSIMCAWPSGWTIWAQRPCAAAAMAARASAWT